MASPSSIRPSKHVGYAYAGVLAALLCLPSLPAAAQWNVTDKEANKVLGSQNKGGSINDNIYNIDQKLKVTTNASKPGDRMTDPLSKLPEPDGTESTLDDGTRCKAVAKEQTETCNKIVEIENAQYKYMLTVYKTSNDRNEVLKALLTERNELKEDDYGRITDNTNKLTALYSLIALDRQQMESVNYAYEANLRYLRAKQAMAANSAQTGSKPGASDTAITLPGVGEVDLGKVIQGLTTGLVLQGALSKLETDRPSEFKKLSISKDSSWW